MEERPLDSKGKPTNPVLHVAPRRHPAVHGGLWSVWHPKDDADAPALLSCSILTTDAVGKLQDVHDRMPLIMPFDHWGRWLDPDHLAPSALFRAPPEAIADAVDIREVSPLVNRIANNGPELLAGSNPCGRSSRTRCACRPCACRGSR